MQPITYLCFTLLSIVIQFCLMDGFIGGQIESDHTSLGNGTTANNSTDLYKVLNRKPHALYYRTERNNMQEKDKFWVEYNNSSITEAPTTELASAVFDLLYDENVSLPDSDFTTETLFTSSQFDNVTEITLFDKKPSTTTPEMPKRISTVTCHCDLLYKVCDINCCCDNDCSAMEKSMLKNCKERETDKNECDTLNEGYILMCSAQYLCHKRLQSNIFGYLFCIDKVNLPAKQMSNKYVIYTAAEDGLKWHVTNKEKSLVKFTKELYVTGSAVWILTNGTMDYLELPISRINGYCNAHKAVKFLTNDYTKCYVKLKDLHMFDVIKTFDEANIASPKNTTLNSTKVDCSTLHCINWVFLICDQNDCVKYKKGLHLPSCSESNCYNIGVKIQYEFYCNVSLIIKALIKVHVRTVAAAIQFVTQEITVNFYMGNNSIENIVKFSGNPGYKRGLPVIISLSESNHTKHFYNLSLGNKNLLLPYNKDGQCVLTNLTHNTVNFGHNKRIKCRVFFSLNTTHNGTDGCIRIREKIDKTLGLSQNMFISPYGNPQNISDDKWINLERLNNTNIYGVYKATSELHCYNLITRIAYIIAFVNTNDANKDENRILRARIENTAENVTFNIEAFSTVVTVDTNFIDAGKLKMQDNGPPRVNFHLPKDFFFPLPSNKCSSIRIDMIVCLCVIVFLQIK